MDTTANRTGLAEILVLSAKKSPYFGKDLRKAAKATQFIGQGSRDSSTNAYATALSGYANTGSYTEADVVFISSEGARSSRFNPIGTAVGLRGAYQNIDLAISARARFIVDNPADRSKEYNFGERQIAAYLAAHGYLEMEPGLFAPPLTEAPAFR